MVGEGWQGGRRLRGRGGWGGERRRKSRGRKTKAECMRATVPARAANSNSLMALDSRAAAIVSHNGGL